MVKVRTCGTITVPVVVVEGVGLLAAGVVVQDNARPGRGGITSMYLDELGLRFLEMRDDGSYIVVRNRRMTFLKIWGVCLTRRRSITIIIGYLDIRIPLRS